MNSRARALSRAWVVIATAGVLLLPRGGITKSRMRSSRKYNYVTLQECARGASGQQVVQIAYEHRTLSALV
jgi:hypothetical protein